MKHCLVGRIIAVASLVALGYGPCAFAEAQEAPVDCATLKTVDPGKSDFVKVKVLDTASLLRSINDCFNEIATDADNASKKASADDARARIFELHKNYRYVKHWLLGVAPKGGDEAKVTVIGATGDNAHARVSPTDLEAAANARADARDAVRSAMRQAGLVEPFFGALLTGPVFQSVSKTPNEANPGTAVTGTVVIESKHLGNDDNKTIHLSAGGKVGYEPVFIMAVPKDTLANTKPTPSYSSGLVWSIGANVGFPVPGVLGGEITAFGRYGQSSPGAAELVNPTGQTAQVAIPTSAGTGLAKDYWEAGIRAVVFRGGENAVASAHEKGYLLPAAWIQFGARWDRRFVNDASLAGYSAPDQRLFFGFRFNALRVFKDISDSNTGAYELTFGVDRDFALRHGGLPSGTRITLAGSVNLLQALGVSGKAKDAKDKDAKDKDTKDKDTKDKDTKDKDTKGKDTKGKDTKEPRDCRTDNCCTCCCQGTGK